MNKEVPEKVLKLEQGFVNTIREFSVYVGTITADLEKKESEKNERRKLAGRNPQSRWGGSTLKIDLVNQLIFTLLTPSRMMKYNIILLVPMKKWIEDRNEMFFLKAKIFPGAPEKHVKFFRSLWSVEGAMTVQEKNTIWGYWDLLIGIAEDWQALTGWVINDNENLDIPDIDYEKEAEKAGI
jgi:hypothetical protein